MGIHSGDILPPFVDEPVYTLVLIFFLVAYVYVKCFRINTKTEQSSYISQFELTLPTRPCLKAEDIKVPPYWINDSSMSPPYQDVKEMPMPDFSKTIDMSNSPLNVCIGNDANKVDYFDNNFSLGENLFQEDLSANSFQLFPLRRMFYQNVSGIHLSRIVDRIVPEDIRESFTDDREMRNDMHWFQSEPTSFDWFHWEASADNIFKTD